MRWRDIFNQAVIGGKKYISKQNSDMCFGIALQKNNLSVKILKQQLFFGEEKKGNLKRPAAKWARYKLQENGK